MSLLEFSPCTCCNFQHFIVTILAIFISIFYLLHYTKIKVEDNKIASTIHILLNVLFWLAVLIVTALVLFLIALQWNLGLRQKFFANLVSKSTSSGSLSFTEPTPFDKIRCDHVGNVEGTVLEIGLGPGPNFRCWAKRNKYIKKYIGIEINPYFKPMEIIWLNMSATDEVNNNKITSAIKGNSIDVVITTHVLCSVSNMDDVLHTIYRSLKLKGKYYFLEHILADSKDSSFMYTIQAFVSPLLQILGNGCQFKPFYELFTYMKNSHKYLKNFDITIEKFNAPLPIPFVAPHVKGLAIKIK